MDNTTARRLWRAGAAAGVGAAAALAFYDRFARPQLTTQLERAFVQIYLVALFALVAYLLLFRLIVPCLRKLSRRGRLVIAVAVAFPAIVLATQLPARPALQQLEITATREQNSQAQASQLWVSRLQHADGSRVSPEEFGRQGLWQQAADGTFSSIEQEPATLRWQGWLHDDATLVLIAHPWSGIARVRWNGQEQLVDLYADPAAERFVSLSPVPDVGTVRALTAFVGDVLAIWVLLLSLAAAMLARPVVRQFWHIQRSQIQHLAVPEYACWYRPLYARWPTHALNTVLALLLAAGLWVGLKTLRVPDDRLSLRMSVEAPGVAAGEIRWGERARPYKDGWPISLTTLQLNKVRDVAVEIAPLPRGSVEPAALSNQVWLLDISTDLVPILNWERATYGDEWIKEARAASSSGYLIKHTAESSAQPLVYHTQTTNWIWMSFYNFPWAEAVKVTIDGRSSIFDLHRGIYEDDAPHFATRVAPAYELNDVGLLTLPLPQNTDHFQISLNEQVSRLRLYGIERVGRSSWTWRPGMPLQTGVGARIAASTQDYIELQTEPGGRLQFGFQELPIKPYYWPGAIGLILILLLALPLFGVLTWRRALCWHGIQIVNGAARALTAPPPEIRLGRVRWILLGAALLLRLKYALEDPVVIMSDSSSYLEVAFWVKHGFSYPLVGDRFDLRGPGYSVFLGLVFLLLGTSYTSIIVVQTILGLLMVYGGMRIGELLGSRWIALALGLLFAFAPDYIWYEHAVMTEVLSNAAIVGCTISGLQFLRTPNKLRHGLLLALFSAVAIYTRPTLLALIALLLLLPLVAALKLWIVSKRRNHRLLAHWLITVTLLAALVGPWVIRNGQVYGRYSLLAATERGRLLFWMWGDLLDLSLPRIAPLRDNYDESDRWMWAYLLGDTRLEGEQIAQALWNEQLTAYPRAYLDRVAYSTANLLGQRPGDVAPEVPRLDLTFQERTYTPGQDSFEFGGEMLEFVPYGTYGPTVRLLGAFWRQIYDPLRLPVSLLTIVIVAIIGIWLTTALLAGPAANSSPSQHFVALIIIGFGAVWLATIALLGLSIAYGPRYILPFDWIRILIVAWAGEAVWQATANLRMQQGVTLLPVAKPEQSV